MVEVKIRKNCIYHFKLNQIHDIDQSYIDLIRRLLEQHRNKRKDLHVDL